MYVSMKDMLSRANDGNYAVMAINCFNLESAKATIMAAQEMKAPIIIDLLQDHLKFHFDSHILTQPIIKMANEASVEVAINLDHGQEVAFVKRCIVNGFSSVMMDASAHPLEENIAITKGVVDFAKIYNASVEAEVGNMGSVSLKQTDDNMYTNVENAIYFIKKTGVDALAISYGSSHGDYPEGYEPQFRFDIIEKIKSETNCPLVLHGGSGCGEKNIRKSVELGINKINVGSDFMKAQLLSIRDSLDNNQTDFVQVMHDSMLNGKEKIKYYIDLAGSEGKSI